MPNERDKEREARKMYDLLLAGEDSADPLTSWDFFKSGWDTAGAAHAQEGERLTVLREVSHKLFELNNYAALSKWLELQITLAERDSTPPQEPAAKPRHATYAESIVDALIALPENVRLSANPHLREEIIRVAQGYESALHKNDPTQADRIQKAAEECAERAIEFFTTGDPVPFDRIKDTATLSRLNLGIITSNLKGDHNES